MQVSKVDVTRIMLRDRGTVSEISVDGELIIIQDNPDDDALVQHITEVVRVSTLSPAAQKAIKAIFILCKTRLERQYGVTNA